MRCRQDLESNSFWKSLGFENYGVWEKGKINHVGFKASDDINLWKIELNKNIITLFDDINEADVQLFSEGAWEKI